jgi:hypothetical protein
VWRYLKAAFLARVDLPTLGRVPVNLLGVLGFGIVGFGEPALWLVGLGLESTYLLALTFNRRFQNVVDAQHVQMSESDAAQKRAALIRGLPPELQRRLNDLTSKCAKVVDVTRQTDDFVFDTNRDALERLEWVYLKLLVARNNLTNTSGKESEQELAGKIAALTADLRDGEETEALRESKTATLAILRERLANIRRRRQTLEEIDSDMTRIESQVELVLENASMQGKPQTISSDIELASNLFGRNLFGESETAVADLEQAYGGPKQVPGPRLEREGT